jgi:hypothetical protein
MEQKHTHAHTPSQSTSQNETSGSARHMYRSAPTQGWLLEKNKSWSRAIREKLLDRPFHLASGFASES